MQISVIINPSSADAVAELRAGIAALREAGHVVHPRLTFESGDAWRFAWKAAEYGADLVVACGGDGTINEVVNGLYDWIEERAEEDAGKKPALPRLGVVPLGTGNDLAGGLGIRGGDPQEALAIAVAGVAWEVDVGRVNGRYFLNVSTGGFGAEATDETPQDLKRVLGPVAYLLTGVRKFVHLSTTRARFTTQGEVLHDGEFLIFAVGNARRTGGGNLLTVEADMNDRLLDVCIVDGMNHVDFVRIAPQIRAGRHVDNPRVTYRKVPCVTVESTEELTVNADGEPIHGTRFEYALAPWRLTLMAPQPQEPTGRQPSDEPAAA